MERPVVFLAFANEQSVSSRYLRNLPEEARNLRETLERAEAAGLCELVLRTNATIQEIFDVFQDYADRIAVFHFGGHADGYDLLLEASSGNASPLRATSLAGFLSQNSALQLVFLNACATAAHVQALLSAGVRSVVATSEEIDDQAATEFATRFYRGLSVGADIQTAFGQATHAVDPNVPQRMLLPWDLAFAAGAESVGRWSLPEASGNPLFGLPLPKTFDLPLSPYRHLLWFKPEHWEIFFGRDTEVRDLYRAVTADDGAPVILFFGQSGVGKSSLLEAGLVPRLEAHAHVLHLRRDPEKGLAGTLEAAFGTSDPADIRKAWEEESVRTGKLLVLIIDQLEEAYTRPRLGVADEIGSFVENIRALFSTRDGRPAGKLVLSFRKEWLAEIRARLTKSHVPYEEHFLETLTKRGMLEVIMGPRRSERLRRQYRLDIADGLAERIVVELSGSRDSPVAPILQILLTDLWQAATSSGSSTRRFDDALYEPLQRQGLSLQRFLSRQFDALRALHTDATDSGLLLDILFAHTTPLGTANQCTVSVLSGAYPQRTDLPDILRSMQDHYLLTDVRSAVDGEEACTRLMHDTLAPIVRNIFETSARPGQRARRILANRAAEWRQGAKGQPLDQVDLQIVENGRDGMRQWDADELRLLKASRQQARKRKNRRQVFIASAWVTALVMGALAFVLYGQNRSLDSERERVQALNDEMKVRARSAAQATFNFNLSVEAGLAGVPSDIATQRLRDGQRLENRFRGFSWGWLQRQRDRRFSSFDIASPLRSDSDDFFGVFPELIDAHFAPSAHSLVLTGQSPLAVGLYLWRSDIAGQRIRGRAIDIDEVHRVSADGRITVSRASSDSFDKLVALDIDSGKREELAGFDTSDVVLAISRDAQTIAVANKEKLAIWSWRARTVRAIDSRPCHSLAFSKDGAVLVCLAEADVRVIDPRTLRILRSNSEAVPKPAQQVAGGESTLEEDLDPSVYFTRGVATRLAIHPDGAWIGYIKKSHVGLWNWKTGERRVVSEVDDASALALSTTLLAIARSRVVELRKLDDLRLITSFDSDSSSHILRFSDDAALLMTAGVTGRISLWQTSGKAPADVHSISQSLAIQVSDDARTAHGIKASGENLALFSLNLASGAETVLNPSLLEAEHLAATSYDPSLIHAELDENGGAALLYDSVSSARLWRWNATGIATEAGPVQASFFGGVLSKGGKYLATSDDQELTVRDVATGSVLWARKCENARQVNWSVDQREIAYLSGEHLLEVAKTTTGEVVGRGNVPSNDPVSRRDIEGDSLGFSADGKALILVVKDETGEKSSVFRVDRRTFKFSLILYSEQEIRHALLTLDGEELITLDDEGTVGMWDARNGQRRAQYKSELKPQNNSGLWLSRDGMSLAASDGAGRILTMRSSPSRMSWFPKTDRTPLDAKTVVVSPDGIALLDTYPFPSRVAIDGGSAEGTSDPVMPSALSLRPDSAVLGNALMRSGALGQRSVLDEAAALIESVPEEIESLAVWDGGTAIAVQLKGGTTRVLRKDEPAWQPDEPTSAFAVTTDGKLLAVSGPEHVSLWNLPTGTRLLRGEGSETQSMQFSADGRYVMALDRPNAELGGRRLAVYDTQNNLKVVFELDKCVDATFTAVGQTILVAMDERVFPIYPGTWELGPTLIRNRAPIRSITYSPSRGEVISFDTAGELQTARLQ